MCYQLLSADQLLDVSLDLPFILVVDLQPHTHFNHIVLTFMSLYLSNDSSALKIIAGTRDCFLKVGKVHIMAHNVAEKIGLVVIM